MIESASVLKEALIELKRTLKERGFAASGATFHRKAEDGNTVMLSVQKSKNPAPGRVQLTLNYGIYCALIGSRLEGDDGSAPIDVTKAHWRKRLSDGAREKWLSIEATDSSHNCARVIVDAAEGVLAELGAHSSNTALRDEWMAGSSPGLTDMQRLLFLAILVSEIGPNERLEGLVEELRALVSGSVHERLVARQLGRAGVRVSG